MKVSKLTSQKGLTESTSCFLISIWPLKINQLCAFVILRSHLLITKSLQSNFKFRDSPSYVLDICQFLSLDRHKSFRLTSTDLLVIIISDFNFGKFFASFVKFSIFSMYLSPLCCCSWMIISNCTCSTSLIIHQ